MYLKIKRISDLLISVILIIILSPFFGLIYIILKISGIDKPIYKQIRSGKDNKNFMIYKFRTYNKKNCVSSFCKVLRKTGLDELLQLFNILKGDMSFVGPRPWLIEYSKYFTDEQKKRLNLLPGLTGLTQVTYLNNVFEKITNDIYYIDNVSLKMDIYIIFNTIKIILLGQKEDFSKEEIRKEIYALSIQKEDKKSKLVSIVIPVYNEEKYITKCLNSVLSQTYKNIEIIVVDDKSIDNTVALIEKIDDKRIKLIKLDKNGGVANARNKGILLAKGDYLCFLDGDDFWVPSKLEKQLIFIKGKTFIYSDFTYYNNGKEKRVKVPVRLSYKDALKNTCIFTSTVMFDMNRVDKKDLHMPNLKIGEDTYVWWNVLKKGIIAYGMNDSLAYYRVGNKSLSSNKFKAIKCAWNLYGMQKLNILKRLYCYFSYLKNAIKKRIG